MAIQCCMASGLVPQAKLLLVASAVLFALLPTSVQGGIANELSYGMEYNDGAGTTIQAGKDRRCLRTRQQLSEPKAAAV
jgi:hypothetical protein